MEEYSYTELGMLIGTALGGTLAVICYSFVKYNLLFLLIAVTGAVSGIFAGKLMDKKLKRKVDKDE